MKLIDTDKLIKFKETLADIIVSSQGICSYQDCKDIAEKEALLLIATLQQEQPEEDFNEGYIADAIQSLFPTAQFIESEYLGLDREEAISFARYFIKLGRDTHNEPLQIEISLRKFIAKIDGFQKRYKYPEIILIKGAMAFMARMFYQYPNIARQWYEQLPKATMD